MIAEKAFQPLPDNGPGRGSCAAVSDRMCPEVKAMKSNSRAFLATVALLAFFTTHLCAGCFSVSLPAKEEEAAPHQDESELQAELEQHVSYMRRNAANLASIIHRMINEERKKNRLGNLEWDRQLAEIALSHSEDMAERGYFDHLSPEGEDFSDRYREYGYTEETRIGNQVYVGGENLFQYNVVASTTYGSESNEVYDYVFNDLEDLARAAVEGWMESPGHRENILAPFSREGIGVAVTDEGEVYITENFS
jgi:uncharacterized protein YkwD